MDTSNKPQTSFIMPDNDAIVTPNWLDNREIELVAASEIRVGSSTWVSARYKGTSETAPMKKYTVDRCGTIESNGLFTSTTWGNAHITGTATNGKTATCEITIIDKTRIGLNNNNSSASISSTEAWKGETISINAGSRAGYKFAGWTADSPSSGTFGNAALVQTTFTIGRTGTIGLTANWELVENPIYSVHIIETLGMPCTGSGNYHEGDIVTISVNPGLYRFTMWDVIEGGHVSMLADRYSLTTTFVMPSNPVVVQPYMS